MAGRNLGIELLVRIDWNRWVFTMPQIEVPESLSSLLDKSYKLTRLGKRILFAIVPRGYWLVLAAAILFALVGGEFTRFAYIAFNVVLFLLALKLAVFVHEVGHLLFAKLVGGRPRRMVLGRGHEVAKTEFGGIKVILHANFNSGLAYAAFDNMRFICAKLLFYTCGGFCINFLIGFALYYPGWGFSPKFAQSIQLTSVVGIANLLTGISALVPYYIKHQGMRIPTDGLSILKLPFYKRKRLLEVGSVNEQLDAYELLESKQYAKAIEAYEHYRVKTEGSKAVALHLSIAYLKQGDFETSTQLLEEVLPAIDEEPFKTYKSFIYNGLAWNYLVQDRLEEAYTYAEQAYKIDSHSEYTQGTWASVLIEQGEFKKGITLLAENMDFNFPNSQTLCASIYLALAYTKLDKPKKANNYLEFLERNAQLLEVDEWVLYERMKEKTGPPVQKPTT